MNCCTYYVSPFLKLDKTMVYQKNIPINAQTLYFLEMVLARHGIEPCFGSYGTVLSCPVLYCTVLYYTIIPSGIGSYTMEDISLFVQIS